MAFCVTPRWKNHRHHSYLWYSRNANTLLLVHVAVVVVIVVANGQKWISVFVFISPALKSYLNALNVCVLRNERIKWIYPTNVILSFVSIAQSPVKVLGAAVCAFLFIFFKQNVQTVWDFWLNRREEKSWQKHFRELFRWLAGLAGWLLGCMACIRRWFHVYRLFGIKNGCEAAAPRDHVAHLRDWWSIAQMECVFAPILHSEQHTDTFKSIN